MTAPATTHDLRCAELRDPLPSGPVAERCTCRPRNVVHLGTSRMCAVCAGLPDWQVGTALRACDRCLPGVLADFYAHDYDGFTPAVVAPIRAPRGAA